MMTENSGPGGRARDAIRTKARIIAAAQEQFAAQGYARTRLREIAVQAGVAVSLLPQHFGSKAELFEAALFQAMAESPVLDVAKTRWGAAMVDHICGDGDVRLPAMVILSTGESDAREITARIMRERVIPELAERLGPPDASARAMQITMLATGFLIYARQLPIGAIDGSTRRQFARLIQTVVNGSRVD